MFFAYNSSLGPPYHIIVDTNFINFSIQVRPARLPAPSFCAAAALTPTARVRRTRSS